MVTSHYRTAGEIVTSRETVATTCVYCQRPVVLEAQMAGVFRPQYVLPFAKTREDAIAAFREYVKKPLLPEFYRRAGHAENHRRLCAVFGCSTVGWTPT